MNLKEQKGMVLFVIGPQRVTPIMNSLFAKTHIHMFLLALLHVQIIITFKKHTQKTAYNLLYHIFNYHLCVVSCGGFLVFRVTINSSLKNYHVP